MTDSATATEAEKVTFRLIVSDPPVRVIVLIIFVIMLGFGALNVGIIAGGPLGGVVAHAWGLASPLFVYAGLCLSSGLLYLKFMPDPNVVGRVTPKDAV